MPNYEADRSPYVGAGDRAERRRLGAILADVLTGTNELPNGFRVLASPANCDTCYRMRAVVEVDTYYPDTHHTLCMDHAEQAYGQQRTCRDCARCFYGPRNCMPGWGVRNEVTGIPFGEEVVVCYECSANYRRCTECRNYYNGRTSQQCCVVVPRCNFCNRREESDNALIADVVVMSHRDFTQTQTISQVCAHCMTSQITECVSCTRNVRRTDSYAHLNTGNVCMGCVGGYVTGSGHAWDVCGRHGTAYRPEMEELTCCDPNATIHPYSYKPTARYKGEGPLYLGAEIEISTHDISASANVAGKGFKGLVYLKDDGSVSSGFEMVSHPLSFGYWANEFPWDTFAKLRESGAYEHRSCGIHVHASRAGFSGPAHQHKWLAFFDRNQQMIEKVARRSGSSYARFGQLSPRDKKVIALRKNGEHAGYFQRYSAVNVNNEHTYEVRIFATSLDANVVFSAISFVSATIEYTRQLKGRDVMKSGGMTWDGFRAYVESQPQYATLLTEMNRVGA
jgi:hypothetical protein